MPFDRLVAKTLAASKMDCWITSVASLMKRSEEILHGLFDKELLLNKCNVTVSFPAQQTESKCHCYPDVPIRKTILTHYKLKNNPDQVTERNCQKQTKYSFIFLIRIRILSSSRFTY